MSGYEYSSAGSQYTYDTIEASDYEAFEAPYPTWDYTQNQFNSPISHEQSPIGTCR
jgi:hypothetical protein